MVTCVFTTGNGHAIKYNTTCFTTVSKLCAGRPENWGFIAHGITLLDIVFRRGLQSIQFPTVGPFRGTKLPMLDANYSPPSSTECPTTYQTRQFFNNSKTNEDIATRFEQEYVRCVTILIQGLDKK